MRVTWLGAGMICVLLLGSSLYCSRRRRGILGSLAGGAISIVYCPEGSGHDFETTLNNTLIGVGTTAAVNILQEFVLRKVTPKKLKVDPPIS